MHCMVFYQELDVFGAVSVRKKTMKFLTKVRYSLYFQFFPWRFYFMRGGSLVELVERANCYHRTTVCTYERITVLYTAGTFNMPTSYH